MYRWVIFDLDGTLYQDRVIYPRIISHFFADTPYAPWIPAGQSGSGQRGVRSGAGWGAADRKSVV